MLTRKDIVHMAVEIPATLGLFFLIALMLIPHALLMSTTGLIAYAGFGVLVIWFTVRHKIQRRKRLIKSGAGLLPKHNNQKLLRFAFSPAAIATYSILIGGLIALRNFYDRL